MQIRLPNGQLVYQQDYSCIIEPQNGRGGIYIGNLEAAQNLKTLRKHGIRAILTAAKGVDLTHSKSDIPFYLQVPGEDRDGFDMTRYFAQGVNFIKDALQNTSIMVHCLAGVSRSVCLVLAYFIKCKGFSYDEAYNLVKMKRSIIHPNQGFIAQLRKYEAQVRGSSASPTKYQISSPSKRRYEYYYEEEQNGTRKNNPESAYNPKYEPYYASPSKQRATIEPGYSNVAVYESPSKRTFQQLVIDQGYESPSKNDIYSSPSKKRVLEGRDLRDPSIFQPTITVDMRRMHSYREKGDLEPSYQLRHFSPERRRMAHNPEPKGRSNSILDPRKSQNPEAKKLYGNYDRLRHTSAVELSQQLDNKIAAIRQKYSEYSKNPLNMSRRVSGRESEPRVNNFMDENQIGLSGNLTMKKISSDYEGLGPKIGGREYGIVNNGNFGRASAVGLGLRRLNSLREGY